MKTSNKLIIAALVLALCSLAAYNIALRAEYKTGKFRDPFRNYTALHFADFDEVDLHAADMLRVTIEPGDKHEVYLYTKNQDYVQLRQNGKRLHVHLALPEEGANLWSSGRPNLIIKMPQLALLRTDATHTAADGKQVTEAKRPPMEHYYMTEVRGFAQDSLVLELDNGSVAQLQGNTLQLLRATTGLSPESETKLRVMEDNKIARARFDVRHASYLALLNAAIPEVDYQLSEKARVELQGESLAALRK